MRRDLNLILDLTSRCNLRCKMCYFSQTDRLSFVPHDIETDGNMADRVFEMVATELFPRARRVALGCAAEPLLHPRFDKMLEIAARYRVPDLWFPTNLLTLTEAKARAIVETGVNTVAVSIDGTHRQIYEAIRVGGSWDRLVGRLDLLRRVRRDLGSRTPNLRIIFTWMQSNFEDLKSLPEFAVDQGATELDVRFVAPTVGVDNSAELLENEGSEKLNDILWSVARDAVGRGLRLASFPEMQKQADADNSLIGKLGRRLWLLRAGLDRPEYWRNRIRENMAGCAYPGTTLLIRPNGAVLPCPFWEQQPLGVMPDDQPGRLLHGQQLTAIRDGLKSGDCIGSCVDCDHRRDALYRPFRKSLPVPVPERDS